jgi:hypothetical protein
MPNTFEISKHITLGSTSIWLNIPFLLFITKPNIIISRYQKINVKNTIFTLLLFKTMVISVLNWNPQYISMSPNPFEKLDRNFAKTIYFFILYFKISNRGFKTKFIQPIVILISFIISQLYSKTQNHVKHTLVHLLFRHLGFIWTMELIDKKALLKTMPVSIFYWLHSILLLYKYRNITLNVNNEHMITRNYFKECEYVYIYSIVGYFYSLKKLA